MLLQLLNVWWKCLLGMGLSEPFVQIVVPILLEICGAEQILTIGFRPQANGVVERVNAEVKRHLQAIVSERNLSNRWSRALPLVQRILNATVNDSTGYAPSVMLFGLNVDLNRGIIKSGENTSKIVECPRYVQDLMQMQQKILEVSQERHADVLENRISKRQSKKGADLKKFNEGDLVVTVREVGSKLDLKWKGPYRVVKKMFANVYELEDLRTKKKVYRDVSSLRSFKCTEGVDPLSVAGSDEGEYVVHSILGHRLEGNKKKNKTHYYFLVKFEDGTEDWLPYMEVRDLQVFEEYLRNHLDFARMLKLKISD